MTPDDERDEPLSAAMRAALDHARGIAEAEKSLEGRLAAERVLDLLLQVNRHVDRLFANIARTRDGDGDRPDAEGAPRTLN